MLSNENLTFLQPIDSYIKTLRLTRIQFFSIILGIIFVLIYFIFKKQLIALKESIKSSLRKQVQGFTVQTHLSEDGKTLETTENPSMMARVMSMVDSMFLAPDDDQEGFQDEEDDSEEEGFEDGDSEEEGEEGFEDGDSEEEEEEGGDQ